MRIEHHPIGVLVREDGCVYLPQSGKHPAHWTFGNKRKDGYCRVRIAGKLYLVHRLVAETFLPNPENKPFVDHINRNTSQNFVGNLRWVSHSENMRNTQAHDNVEYRSGTHQYESKQAYNTEYYSRNRTIVLIKQHRYDKSHRRVLFSDGKKRWFPNEQATELLKLPVKERIYDKV